MMMQTEPKVWRSETRETECNTCGWPIRAGQYYQNVDAYEGDKKVTFRVDYPTCPLHRSKRSDQPHDDRDIDG